MDALCRSGWIDTLCKMDALNMEDWMDALSTGGFNGWVK